LTPDLGAARPQIQGQEGLALGQDQSGKISSIERVGLGLRPNPTCGWRGPAPTEGGWVGAVPRSRTKRAWPTARPQGKTGGMGNVWVEGTRTTSKRIFGRADRRTSTKGQ
jgi:hypothetical protein